MAPLHMLFELLIADELAPALLKGTDQRSTLWLAIVLLLLSIHAELFTAEFEHGLGFVRSDGLLLNHIGRLARRINQLGLLLCCAFLFF